MRGWFENSLKLRNLNKVGKALRDWSIFFRLLPRGSWSNFLFYVFLSSAYFRCLRVTEWDRERERDRGIGGASSSQTIQSLYNTKFLWGLKTRRVVGILYLGAISVCLCTRTLRWIDFHPLTPKTKKISYWAENLTTDSSGYSKSFSFYSFIFISHC